MDTASNPAPGFARNPAKSITVEPFPQTVIVKAGDQIVARSRSAKKLTESPYPPVLYVPFADIDFAQLEKTAHSTHCPYKGDASYWSVVPAGDKGKDAMWAYEHPYDEMLDIKSHGAFYPDRVTIETA
jgi:uncharacterized protein (DUF427 family)